MKIRIIITALILLGLQSVCVLAESPSIAPVETNPSLHSNGQGWRFEREPNINSTLPRVLLIGDSVLNGYLSVARKALEGKANVDAWVSPYWQSVQTNQLLAETLENGPYDVIHFNIGLHGWARGRIPEGQYEPLTKAYVGVMREKCPKAKLIWATITPVMIKGKPSQLDPVINSTIIEHNRMALHVMKETGVTVNDFYALLVNQLDLAKGDQFHWTPPADKLMGEAAAASILKALSAEPQASSGLQQENPIKEGRMEWWREAKFGLFIHWGLYAVPAGVYKGKPAQPGE